MCRASVQYICACHITLYKYRYISSVMYEKSQNYINKAYGKSLDCSLFDGENKLSLYNFNLHFS